MARQRATISGDILCQENPLELLTDEQWRSVAELLGLSRRELEIIHGIFDGKKEGEIAQELGVSPHTVHTYLERVHRKLAVSNRCDLIVRVFAAYVSLGFSRQAQIRSAGAATTLPPSNVEQIAVTYRSDHLCSD